ncbi:MAG: trimeric intracellular cation channel family protein [Kiritimatiellia bacterium]
MEFSFFTNNKDAIILFLDLFGTAIFAITGALRGFRAHLDFLGVVVLACAVGVGGGITRDALIGATPVAAFEDSRYIILCAFCGAAVFLFAPRLNDRWNIIPVLDALGLGVFTAIGAEKAWLQGCGWVAITLCGVITAVGGGVLRDVFVMRVPAVLRSDFYATAALLGGLIFVAITQLSPDFGYFGRFLIVAVSVLLMRLVAMRFRFRLPEARSVPHQKRWDIKSPRRKLPKE